MSFTFVFTANNRPPRFDETSNGKSFTLRDLLPTQNLTRSVYLGILSSISSSPVLCAFLQPLSSQFTSHQFKFHICYSNTATSPWVNPFVVRFLYLYFVIFFACHRDQCLNTSICSETLYRTREFVEPDVSSMSYQTNKTAPTSLSLSKAICAIVNYKEGTKTTL